MRTRSNRNRRPRILGLGLALLLPLAPANAVAQGAPKPPKAAKEPAPPLFPRHRRGTYLDREGLETIDATPQSPPLETDDPGVPDNGEYEINLTTHADISKDAQSVDLLFVDANYGVLPRIAGHELPMQVKFEVPVTTAREHGDSFTFGLGAAKFGLKFNFYSNEHNGLSISVYPQMEFEAPGTGSIEKGLADPGQTLILPLLVAKEFHYFTFVTNAALNKPLHDPERETTDTFGVGFGRAFTRKIAAMVEVRDEVSSSFNDNHLLLLNVGLIHGVRRVIVYTKLGHSLFSDDGFGHTYLGIGMKFLIHTKEQKTTSLTDGYRLNQPVAHRRP
jgi:hypothetical protein